MPWGFDLRKAEQFSPELSWLSGELVLLIVIGRVRLQTATRGLERIFLEIPVSNFWRLEVLVLYQSTMSVRDAW
jgi:hypothetical protein